MVFALVALISLVTVNSNANSGARYLFTYLFQLELSPLEHSFRLGQAAISLRTRLEQLRLE
jgi:hypothetical protein